MRGEVSLISIDTRGFFEGTEERIDQQYKPAGKDSFPGPSTSIPQLYIVVEILYFPASESLRLLLVVRL
ncbi:hypothetical protein D8674_039281 [Pyrus ussuriensis x Pyrus communis]|uniref:Uncharacterized protein n=1 Tax=Pyrus ussuriensis x Pyrus communis TaxID=2448454 RepID=A0A5N5GZV2_9ROSA|nr:hypothetical protein D8674_039281 [Pyrus ussuriensis x Pyrus communis]